MSSLSLPNPLLFFIGPRIGQIQQRIDNAGDGICHVVLHFVFLLCVLFHGVSFFLCGCRIQLVENVGRKLLSQHRPVGDDAGFVVDERYTVDSAHRVDTEYRVDTVSLQQLPEFVPCVTGAHGIADCLSQAVERAFFL